MPPKTGFMIAIMPGGPHGGQDEDSLNREQDGDSGGDDNDIATEIILSILRRLHRGGPSAIRDLRAFTAALDAMCEASMARDHKGLEDAANDAGDALESMINA
jgi:streptomycin 6-kinase